MYSCRDFWHIPLTFPFVLQIRIWIHRLSDLPIEYDDFVLLNNLLSLFLCTIIPVNYLINELIYIIKFEDKSTWIKIRYSVYCNTNEAENRQGNRYLFGLNKLLFHVFLFHYIWLSYISYSKLTRNKKKTGVISVRLHEILCKIFLNIKLKYWL